MPYELRPRLERKVNGEKESSEETSIGKNSKLNNSLNIVQKQSKRRIASGHTESVTHKKAKTTLVKENRNPIVSQKAKRSTPVSKNKKNTNQRMIFEFKIILADIEPMIWRRIQVPSNFTFFDFHCAIQDAMGWTHSHMHQFKLLNQSGKEITIGTVNEFNEDDTLPERNHRLSDYLKIDGGKKYTRAFYEYDFGDSWEHFIELEREFEPEPGVKYPNCVAGERSCPPEDCGGSYGYEELLKIIKNKKHSEHKDMMNWLKNDRAGAGPFNPEHFDPRQVIFANPNNWAGLYR